METTRRRFLAQAATVASSGIAVSLLGGCGNNPSTGKGPAAAVTPLTEVKPFEKPQSYGFSNIIGPQPKSTPKSQWLVDVASSWKQHTGDTVDLHFVPSQDYEASELQTEFASGTGPDMYMISAGDFLRYYNNGAMLDLTPYVTKDAFNDFVPGVLDSRSVDKKLYGIPEEVQPICVFYREDSFEKAHLSEADIPKTWDQLIEVAHKLTTKSQFGMLVETNANVYQNFTWYPFMWMGGGDVVKDGKSTFNSAPTIAALKFWQTLVNEGVAPRKELGGNTNAAPNLGSGYCAMQIAGVWSVPDMAVNAKNVKYGIFPLPVPPGGKYLTIVGGWAWCVNPKSPHADRAAKFATYGLTSNTPQGEDNIKKYTIVASNMPTLKSVSKEVISPDGAYSKGIMRTFVDEIATNVRAEPRYPAEVWQAVSAAIQATQLNNQNPEQAAEKADQQIAAYLKTYDGAPML